MSLNQELFNKIKEINKVDSKDSFIQSNLIINQINFLFPNLNKEDHTILLDLTIYLINFISNKFYFEENSIYKNVWIENNFRNIKSAILKILPFIDDKDNFRLYKKINDLNQILFYLNKQNLPKDIDEMNMKDALKNYFPISNFTLGLLGSYKSKNKLKFIDDNNEQLIYKLIHHNFISLLETIKISSSKLYINWINIIPIHLDTLENSKVYKNTMNDYKKLSNVTDHDSYSNFEKEYNGLNIGDLYNVFRNGYFQNIKNIKWLIFNKISTNSVEQDSKGKYYIQLIEQYLEISKYKGNLRYTNLTDKLIHSFDENIKNMIKQSTYKFELIEMIKSIIMFLVNNYSYKNLINKEIKDKYKLNPIEQEKTENEDLDYNKALIEKINKKTDKEIINDFTLIGNEHIYNYIYESVDEFKTTIYYTFLYDDDDVINQSFFNIKYNNEIDTHINLKNLYNIAKALSFYNKDNKWVIQNPFFGSLLLESRIHFFDKITNENISSWLNIRRNIQSQNQNSQNDEDIILQKLYQGWNTYKIYFIFYYLCKKGLLSKFVPNENATNDSILPSNYSSKIKAIGKQVKNTIKKENLKEAYYYINNKKYGSLENTYEKKDENIIMQTYFERLEKDLNWYTFYAMDWMTQISFFHTYINHQILFITGSTGTGKSTQVPKLLLYALKCIDYRENGKISCTQPRIPPTVGNAKRISEELGVPISIYDSNIDSEVNSDNYNIQYKHQNDQHTSLKNGLQLKITTDGTLFEEIIENTLMKDKMFNKNKEEFEFSLKNKYDILIVDEAHEHGKNMDLILSLARNTCYYNNSVRLVIISATMEDDEPNYRSYYKYINDNMLYPIKKPLIKHPFLDIINFLPQTVLMERRFHISKPGETTQFTITEVEKYSIGDDESRYTKPWDIIQENSYTVIKEIFNNNPTGNALLFLTGEKEIKKAVEELNKIIPKDAVAIPFFGKMDQKYKDIIEKIDKKIGKIKNNKFKIHEEWGYEYIKGTNNNNFKRAVIIATNVAEASITIPNLKFVIDNGYSKQNNFIYSKGDSLLVEEMISNSSRVQRKGRVGRISDGTVYYLYDISSRLEIPTRYNISYEDFSNEFIKLLVNKNNKNYLNSYDDPYLKQENYNLINTGEPINDSLIKIIKNQFYDIRDDDFYDDIFDYDEYFPKDFFNFKNTPIWIELQYLDGFNYRNLFDNAGQFFIIHPFEKDHQRNIYREFIKTKDDKIINSKMATIPLSFNNRLKQNFRAVELGKEYILNHEMTIYRKTNLSKIIEDVTRTFTNIDYSVALTLLCSYSIDLIEEVILIISLLEAINYNIEGLFDLTDLKYKEKINFFKNNYRSTNSDFDQLLKISENFIRTFKLKRIFNFVNSKNILKNEYNRIIDIYFNSNSNNNNNYKKTFYIIKSIETQGKLRTDEGFQEWLVKDEYVENFFDDISDQELNKFCNSNLFNKEAIKMFYKNIVNYKRKLYSIDYKNDPMYDNINPLTWIKNLENNFKISFSHMKKIDKIINLFLIGYSQNVCLKKDIKSDKNEYYKITNYSDKITNIQDSDSMPNNFYYLKENNFVKHNSSLIFYLKMNLKDTKLGAPTLSIISNINEKNLFISNPYYYNPYTIKNTIVILDNSNLNNIYSNNNTIFRNFLNNLKNSFSKSNIIWNNREYLPFLTKAIDFIDKKIE